MRNSGEIKAIRLDRLIGHTGSTNVQSKVTLEKLVRNIERTGLYEPLVVRPMPREDGYYQVINGHYRKRALEKLGHEECDCIVWEVDDVETEILLLTLNRLGGGDKLDKKLNILKRLNTKYELKKLCKMLPLSAKQIERLVNLKREVVPLRDGANTFAKASVFFVDEGQEHSVEEAILLASKGKKGVSRAVRRGAALVEMANNYIQSLKKSL